MTTRPRPFRVAAELQFARLPSHQLARLPRHTQTRMQELPACLPSSRRVSGLAQEQCDIHTERHRQSVPRTLRREKACMESERAPVSKDTLRVLVTSMLPGEKAQVVCSVAMSTTAAIMVDDCLFFANSIFIFPHLMNTCLPLLSEEDVHSRRRRSQVLCSTRYFVFLTRLEQNLVQYVCPFVQLLCTRYPHTSSFAPKYLRQL